MTRKELQAAKERFEKEGFIHENVVRELFKMAEKQVTKEMAHYEFTEPGC